MTFQMVKSDIEKVITVFQGIGSGDTDLATRHINPNQYIEHNPRSAGGVFGLREYINRLSKEDHRLLCPPRARCPRWSRGVIHDLGILIQHRSIDEVKFLLAERDFVFIAAMGTVEGKPCACIDLYRVEGGKIAEHWGFPEKIPYEKECKNYNGLL